MTIDSAPQRKPGENDDAYYDRLAEFYASTAGQAHTFESHKAAQARGTHNTDEDARFIGRVMLLGGSWSEKSIDMLDNRELVEEIANLTDEEVITHETVQAILLKYGYAQNPRRSATDWVDDAHMSAAETRARFEALHPESTRGPDA